MQCPKLFLALLAIASSFVGVQCKAKIVPDVRLRSESGRFSGTDVSTNKRSVIFLIRAGQGKHISVRFDELDLLREDDRLKIQDGRRSTVIHSYKSKNGNYYKTTDKYESIWNRVEESTIQFGSQTQRLFILYEWTSISDKLQGPGFTARYETYPANLCDLNGLPMSSTQAVCQPSYQIAHVASSCTRRCSANYIAKGNLTCINGQWYGFPTCTLDSTVVSQCNIDEEAEDMGCPYSMSEIGSYYATLDDGGDVPRSMMEKSEPGRSFNRKWYADCTKGSCRTKANGYYIAPCRQLWRNLKDKFCCVLCRVRGCRFPNVPFP